MRVPDTCVRSEVWRFAALWSACECARLRVLCAGVCVRVRALWLVACVRVLVFARGVDVCVSAWFCFGAAAWLGVLSFSVCRVQAWCARVRVVIDSLWRCAPVRGLVRVSSVLAFGGRWRGWRAWSCVRREVRARARRSGRRGLPGALRWRERALARLPPRGAGRGWRLGAWFVAGGGEEGRGSRCDVGARLSGRLGGLSLQRPFRARAPRARPRAPSAR